MKKRVADVIFETLNRIGVTDCFCVVGGGAMHLNNALAINDSINTIFNHHEQACAMAAESYARVSGRIACVCVTSGPGATNAITGVMGSWVDSVPMIVISGNVRYETSVPYSGYPLRYRGLQEFDIINSVKNMTKYSCYLTNPNEVCFEVEKAVHLAMEGRRGPVWIDVPQDVQNAMVDEDELIHFDEKINCGTLPISVYEDILIKVKEAKRPCILIGSSIQCTHSEDLLEKLIQLIQIPVVGGAWNGDAFYSEHPLYYGLSGNAGARAGNFILQNSDFIISLGNSLSYKQTGYDIDSFAPKAKICMIDVDDYEVLKHGKLIDFPIKCDIVDFMKGYIENINELICAPDEWIEYCNKVFDYFPSWEGECTALENGRVNKYLLWKCLLDELPNDSLYALGNSSVGMAANQIGRKYKGQRMISNYICGSMGFDLPAAIGVSIAMKKEVYCVTGDGSIMMNLQELQTIISNDLNIKIIIMENEGYGAIRQTCKNFFNGKEFGCSPNTGVSCPDFSKIANAFNYDYNVCETNIDLVDKINWLKNNSKQAILEIKQQLDDPVLPKLMSKLDEFGKMTSPKLHDMYPFVNEEDMNWLMIN